MSKVYDDDVDDRAESAKRVVLDGCGTLVGNGSSISQKDRGQIPDGTWRSDFVDIKAATSSTASRAATANQHIAAGPYNIIIMADSVDAGGSQRV